MSNPTVQISYLTNVKWIDGYLWVFALNKSNDIWRIRIANHLSAIDSFWLLLNTDEQERAGRYYREKDKHRFIVSRAALRILLGRYLNLEPKQVVFEIGENKKPHVKGYDKLHYNVSHSGDFVLIAFSQSDVGVDVELPDHNLHFDEIMSISYSQQEADLVKNAAYPLQTFYTLWTRKEALLKATAKGIDDGLKFIPCVDGFHNILFNTIGSDKNWLVKSFKVDDQHVGSIASAFEKISFLDFGATQHG